VSAYPVRCDISGSGRGPAQERARGGCSCRGFGTCSRGLGRGTFFSADLPQTCAPQIGFREPWRKSVCFGSLAGSCADATVFASAGAHPSWMYSGPPGPRPDGHAIAIACSKIASCDFLARAPLTGLRHPGARVPCGRKDSVRARSGEKSFTRPKGIKIEIGPPTRTLLIVAKQDTERGDGGFVGRVGAPRTIVRVMCRESGPKTGISVLCGDKVRATAQGYGHLVRYKWAWGLAPRLRGCGPAPLVLIRGT
jgi:hypothetical protein